MNDDPTAAASTARLPTRDESDSDSDSDSGVHDDADNGEGTSQHPEGRPRRSRNGRRRSSSRVRRAKAGITKKLEFMTNLMSSLDVLVFAELSVLYYMEYVYAPFYFLFYFFISSGELSSFKNLTNRMPFSQLLLCPPRPALPSAVHVPDAKT